MKSVSMLLAAVVLIFFLAAVVVSGNEFRSRDYIEPHIVTTNGSSAADITLSQILFSSATANVLITSNNTADAPIPFAYVSATKVLTVSGLHANDTRNLSVVYKIDALTDYWGAGIAVRVIPAFLVIGIFGLIGGAVYTVTRREG